MQTLFPHGFFLFAIEGALSGSMKKFSGWWFFVIPENGACDPMNPCEFCWNNSGFEKAQNCSIPKHPASPWNDIGPGILIKQTRQNIIDYLKMHWSLLNSHDKLCCYIRVSNGRFKVIIINILIDEPEKQTNCGEITFNSSPHLKETSQLDS